MPAPAPAQSPPGRGVPIFTAGVKSCRDVAMPPGNAPGKKSPGLGHSHRGLTQTPGELRPGGSEKPPPNQPLFLQVHQIDFCRSFS